VALLLLLVDAGAGLAGGACGKGAEVPDMLEIAIFT
jgi:hypothetical protein